MAKEKGTKLSKKNFQPPKQSGLSAWAQKKKYVKKSTAGTSSGATLSHRHPGKSAHSTGSTSGHWVTLPNGKKLFIKD